MSSLKPIFTAVVLGVLAIGCADTAFAKESQWDRHHPRRDEVNDRLHHQNRRIHREVKEGDMTHAEAANLHAQDRGIRQEERTMASHDNGHITKADKRALNQQENGVSKEIGH